MVATNASGHEVARAVTNREGFYTMHLSPGTFAVAADVSGDPMMRAPASKTVAVSASGSVVVDFVLDTGIR